MEEITKERLPPDVKPYEPAYWHMTGDSFPRQLPKDIEKVVPPLEGAVSKIKIKLQDVQDAHNRIVDHVVLSPIVEAKHVGKKLGKMNVFFKCENLQTTGSFKARGAVNVLASLTPSEKSKGCVVSGRRNFVQAMTYYGHELSVPINVIVPKDCPISDRHRYKENFAIVKVHGNDANDANLHALSYSDEIGAKYIHGSDRPDLIAGYGTVGLEVLSQLDKLDAIICPVGSGELVAGIITAVKSLKPNCLIYGVECNALPVMTRALQERKPVMVPTRSIIAESLSSTIASDNALQIARGYLDRMITVDEASIARAMITLLERERLVVEGAGACSVAAILADKVTELRGKNVVCILTGGNVNSSRMSRLIERGLAADGRLVKFTTTLPDVPGALARLLAKLYEVGVDVRNLNPERTWMKRDIFSISVNMMIETCDANHSKELQKRLEKDYPNSHFIML